MNVNLPESWENLTFESDKVISSSFSVWSSLGKLGINQVLVLQIGVTGDSGFVDVHVADGIYPEVLGEQSWEHDDQLWLVGCVCQVMVEVVCLRYW